MGSLCLGFYNLLSVESYLLWMTLLGLQHCALGHPNETARNMSIRYLYSKVTQLGHTHTHTCILFIFFSIIVYHRILSIVHCAIQEDLVIYPCYIY